MPVAPPPPPPAAGFTSAPLCHLDPETTTSPRAAAPARLLQTEPLKLARKPWGFTSAPLVSRPQIPPPPPSMATPAPATSEPAPPSPPNDVPSAIPRLPGRAGFTSSPLCNVPPKPRVAVGAAEDGPPKPPPPPAEEAEKAATASTASRTLPPVQAVRERPVPGASHMPAFSFTKSLPEVYVSVRPSAPTCSYGSAVLLKQCSLCQSSCGDPEAECFRLPRHQRVQQATFVAPQRRSFRLHLTFCRSQCWQEERQQRADHLRRQRDRLIEKRAKVDSGSYSHKREHSGHKGVVVGFGFFAACSRRFHALQALGVENL